MIYKRQEVKLKARENAKTRYAETKTAPPRVKRVLLVSPHAPSSDKRKYTKKRVDPP
jgi:hypothetical protein